MLICMATRFSVEMDNGSQTEQEPPTVGAVIVNWNNYQDTADCLDSLQTVDYDPIKIVVVDNNSTDDSLRRLQSEYDCEFVQNDQNIGFSAANNRGIEKIRSVGADHVLLLNNDMVVSEGSIGRLVSAITNDEDIAGVGGLVRYKDTEKIWSAGGKHVPYFVRTKNLTKPLQDKPYETNFVSPAFLLLSKDFLNEGQRLDESYFFSVEDQQLAFDAKKGGWKFIVDPASVAYHEDGGSAGTENEFRFYHYTWGRLHFARRNLSTPKKLVFSMFFLITRIVRFAQWFLSGRAELIHATLLAIYDFLTGREPRRPHHFNIV